MWSDSASPSEEIYSNFHENSPGVFEQGNMIPSIPSIASAEMFSTIHSFSSTSQEISLGT